MGNTDLGRVFLADLRAEIASHPGVNHLLLNRLATTPFSKEDYRVFGENHFPLVCVFCSYLEALLVRAPDSEAKLWLAKVLVDEYGEGSEGHDHSEMYARFLVATGGDPGFVKSGRVPHPAARFIARHREIVRTQPFLVGLGAVGPGHEWAIPSMFHAVIPGLRRAGFREEEIAYFTLHVDQDEDHGAWLEEALYRYATTEENRAMIRAGALASLEARREFWDGVQAAVVRWRQPRSARQDAATPRRLAREVALTVWDALPAARRVEAGVRALRDRRLPTVAEIVEQGRRFG
ncbi:MAG: TenA family transcriptional regulator [Myxococcota bacterium]